MILRELEVMGRAELVAIWDRLGPRMREVLITFARRLDYEFEARPRPVATQEEIDAQREAWPRENLHQEFKPRCAYHDLSCDCGCKCTCPVDLAAQRESWARGELAMGSDADEAQERGKVTE